MFGMTTHFDCFMDDSIPRIHLKFLLFGFIVLELEKTRFLTDVQNDGYI